MITTIIFDLSDVYLQGIKDSALLTYELDQLFLGRTTEVEFWQLIKKRYSWDTPIDDLKKAVRDNFKEIKGVRQIIERLSQSGYKLGLLSNHAKEWVEYCEITYKYHKLFHKTLYSFEVGLAKPSRDIFLLVLKKLKVKPEECIFIDDNKQNLAASKQLGIRPIHFTSAANLKKNLHKLKILI